MSDSTPQTVALKPAQVEYLQQAAERHGLPDISKVVRVLIDFAADRADLEQEIFRVVRCRHC